MWQILILVCALSGPCDKESAHFSVRVPEPAPGLAMCSLVGQAYIAETGLVQADERVKILCTASGRRTTA